MRKFIKLFILMLILTLTSVLANSKEVEVIRMKGGDFGAPNPYKNSFRGPGRFKTDIIYDSLIEKDEKGYIPWLAESWKENDKDNTITFKLRENIKWHDGKNLTTEDIKFTIEYFDKFPPVSDQIHDGKNSIIKGVEILKNNEIKITFNRYSVLNLERVGTLKIIPKHIWGKVDNPMAYTGEGYLVGSGPYKVVSYSSEKGNYAFEAFNDFWGMKPAAKRLEWIAVSDPVLAIERGEVSIVDISPNVIDRYKNNSKYGIITGHSYHTYRLMWNQENVKECQDKDVRKAIAHSVNRQNFVDKLEKGYGYISNVEYVLTSNPMHNPKITQYSYSIDEAKKLMKNKTIKATILVSNNPKEIKIAELIKIDLAKIGIDLTVKSVDGKTRDNDVKSGNYEFAVLKLGGMGGDADYLRPVYLSSQNGGLLSIKGYKNEKLDKLLLAQVSERDINKRKELLFEAQEIIADEVPMLPLYAEKFIYVYRKEDYSNYRKRFDNTMPLFTKLTFLKRDK